MGFGASTAKVLHLFSAKGQRRLEKDKWVTCHRGSDAGLPRQQVVAHVTLLT